jgi:hypothetical protein
MRRLLGPVLALLIVLGGAGLTSCRPQEARAEVTRADVRALGPGDTLQIITHYRVSLTQAGGVPDGVSVRVALDSAGSPILHQHRVTDSADTARINAANRYGTLRGSSCVAVSRRGLSSTERCVPWTFVRPDQPPAPADSVRVDSVRIVAIRPVGVQLDPDPQNRCRTWYATHPGGNPWVVVNREAIPECTGASGPSDQRAVLRVCGARRRLDGRGRGRADAHIGAGVGGDVLRRPAHRLAERTEWVSQCGRSNPPPGPRAIRLCLPGCKRPCVPSRSRTGRSGPPAPRSQQKIQDGRRGSIETGGNY